MPIPDRADCIQDCVQSWHDQANVYVLMRLSLFSLFAMQLERYAHIQASSSTSGSNAQPTNAMVIRMQASAVPLQRCFRQFWPYWAPPPPPPRKRVSPRPPQAMSLSPPSLQAEELLAVQPVQPLQQAYPHSERHCEDKRSEKRANFPRLRCVPFCSKFCSNAR